MVNRKKIRKKKEILNENNINKYLKLLEENKNNKSYPPIYDINKKNFISQYENTIYINENKTEILS